MNAILKTHLQFISSEVHVMRRNLIWWAYMLLNATTSATSAAATAAADNTRQCR